MFSTLTPGCPGVKKCLHITGPQENPLLGADVHDFRRGRPRPEGFSKNFVQKKFALIFWPYLRIKKRLKRCLAHLKRPPPLTPVFPGGRFGYFLFFPLRGRERGSRRQKRGVGFLWRGGLPGEGEEGGAEGPGGCLRRIGGEGLNIIFSGPKFPLSFPYKPGGVYFEPPPPRQELYTPPLLYAPPPLEGYFQGWGCIKFGPVLVATIRVKGVNLP